MMATQAQIDANRQNAQKSTGPRTPEGKAKSSRNSLLHGLTAEKHFLEGEDPADFALLAEQFRAEWKPDGPSQDLLVERMTAAHWRLRRFLMMETGLFQAALETNPIPQELAERGRIDPLAWAFCAACQGHDEFTKLARYETHLQREFRNCLHELQGLQHWARSRADLADWMLQLKARHETKPIPQPARSPQPPAPAATHPQPDCKTKPIPANAPPAPCQHEACETKPIPATGHPASSPQPPAPRVQTMVRTAPKVGRNDPCPCGSGRKYKRCCGPKADDPRPEAGPRNPREVSEAGPSCANQPATAA
jgi:hypothetical protein